MHKIALLIKLTVLVIFIGSLVYHGLDDETMRKNPRCYIDYIYVPALDKTLNATPNNIIIFTLKFINPRVNEQVRYSDIHLSFSKFVGPNVTTHLGNATIQGFSQGSRSKAFKHGSLLTAGDLIRPLNGGKVIYRVDFTTTMPVSEYGDGGPTLSGGANVEIDDDLGLKVYREPVIII